MDLLPEVLNNFNIYNDSGNKLIGVSGEVELPELEAITDTLEGCGVLGEIEDPVTGQFSSATIKIPFAVLYESLFSIMNTTKPPQLTLRRQCSAWIQQLESQITIQLRSLFEEKQKPILSAKLPKERKWKQKSKWRFYTLKSK